MRPKHSLFKLSIFTIVTTLIQIYILEPYLSGDPWWLEVFWAIGLIGAFWWFRWRHF